MKKILAIGIATLDIVNTVEEYPAENDEVRASAQRFCRGGNAANTLVVLRQLGYHCDWLGVLANDANSQYITEDFDHYQVNYKLAPTHACGSTPTSYVTLNRSNGSRTIVHYRDLPEYSFDAFNQIDLSDYDWVHFEGRHIHDTARMIKHVRAENPGVPISVEIEKHRDNIEQLFPLPDYLIFSHDYAEKKGIDMAEELLLEAKQAAPNTHIVLTWGKTGAYALNVDGSLHHSIGFPPEKVVDTLGAGDTFNAGLIHALIQQHDLGGAVIEACKLAGQKCAIEGFKLNQLS